MRGRASVETDMTPPRIVFAALGSALFLAFAPLADPVARAQQAPDPRVADLVHAGKVRFALFPSFNYKKDKATGELHGVGIEIAHALAARLGVEVLPVEYVSPANVVDCLKDGTCDVAILGIEPGRAAEVDFSPAYMEADFTFMVPADSAVRSIADADTAGVRVAVVRNHAMDFALRGKLKQAEAIYTETPDLAFEVLAGIRPGLIDYNHQLPGSRVLADRYGANAVALAVPKGQAARLAYVTEFVEAAKKSAFLQQAIENAGLKGIQVAPPAKTF
jgi:polar amino acid transport system substrate-binding protein